MGDLSSSGARIVEQAPSRQQQEGDVRQEIAIDAQWERIRMQFHAMGSRAGRKSINRRAGSGTAPSLRQRTGEEPEKSGAGQ